MKQRTYRNIADFLDSTGTTQAELARRVGCSQAHLCRIQGGFSNPGFRLALRIAEVARVPMSSLLPERFSLPCEQGNAAR